SVQHAQSVPDPMRHIAHGHCRPGDHGRILVPSRTRNAPYMARNRGLVRTVLRRLMEDPGRTQSYSDSFVNELLCISADSYLVVFCLNEWRYFLFASFRCCN